jgi:transposase
VEGIPERQTHDYKTPRHHHAVRRAGDRHRQGDRRLLPPPPPARVPALPKTGRQDLPRQQLRIVCDNYATHKHPKVNDWLQGNPRITLHFTPTSGSWLNMVEIFFGIITRQAIRRGSFSSVKDLIDTIRLFIDGYNDRCQPFTWTKDADTILAKAKRSPKTKDEALT